MINLIADKISSIMKRKIEDQNTSLLGFKEWEDISDKCNFMLGITYYKNKVYINRGLRLIAFFISASGTVPNQTNIVQFGTEQFENSRLLVSSVNSETTGIAVDISCSATGLLTSSHSQNVSIKEPRYSGLVAY